MTADVATLSGECMPLPVAMAWPTIASTR